MNTREKSLKLPFSQEVLRQHSDFLMLSEGWS